jgi:serine/threonine-protein kinase
MYSNNYKTIRGRWSGKNYIIQKKLGAGGIGEIFMVKDDFGMPYAMKVSSDLISITKEYGYLERFSAMRFAPKAYELDDCEKDNRICHYFVMEYVDGDTLRAILAKEKLSFSSKLDIARIITDVLRGINERGYVYTDLKHENIMVDEKNGLIRVIDLGSITPIGARVKEYTPMYDRSCWKAGDRRADLSYQIFAVIILLISLLLGRDMDPERDKLEVVLGKLRKRCFPEGVYATVNGCMNGTIADCGSLCDSLGDICHCSFAGKRLTGALNALIAVLSVLLLVLIRTVFA